MTARVLVVEDDSQMRDDLAEFFERADPQGFPMELTFLPSFDLAMEEVRQRRADLIILDVFQGPALTAAKPTGLKVLDDLKKTGFISVVLYTAHPEKVEEYRSPFVRLVGKDADSLERLHVEILDLFSKQIPQLYRGLSGHVDSTLRDYMWGFVEQNWDVLSELAGTPEFLRVVVQRLAATFSREGIDGLVKHLFGDAAESELTPDCVHPAEFYIMPPLKPDSPLLGDIRVREIEGREEFVVVLWPSCDLVETPTRTAKTDRLLCAVASNLDEAPEVQEWKRDPSKTKEKAVQKLLKNQRVETSERFHALPGVCNLPNLLIDFQKVGPIPLIEVRALKCYATLASPFAESLASRYIRYVGRLGTPDLDISYVMKRMGP